MNQFELQVEWSLSRFKRKGKINEKSVNEIGIKDVYFFCVLSQRTS